MIESETAEVRVKGIDRQRLVDASVIPILPATHIHMCLYTILPPGTVDTSKPPWVQVIIASRSVVNGRLRNHISYLEYSICDEIAIQGREAMGRTQANHLTRAHESAPQRRPAMEGGGVHGVDQSI
ncbi:hypothetical protein BDV28DRAFT_53873 [Aspergillus coremiiformis]|uniref:Glucose-methanol-choline oxidoreductase C-terminal domain-containing protein n=1 Tax=Aspergillus coremiiformis TaxID=138285 RepID=A0A5N6ZED5_9EURO|nr:hypothetical protein BDV28DRAFT_53873 [Aspergillus coremiiformis]